MSFVTRKVRVSGFRGLSLLLSFLLSFQSVFANELPKHQPSFPGQEYEGIGYFARPEKSDEKAWSEFLLNSLQNVDKTNFEKISETGDDLVNLMIQYRAFYAKARRAIDEQIASVGQEKFLDDLDHDRISFEDPELGKMEFTNIDGEPVAKIAHEKSGVSFLIYDEENNERTTKHFKTYVARQHYDAGTTREHNKYIDQNGKERKVKSGRDVILMSIKNEDIAKVEVNSRKRGLKHWWHATYKEPKFSKDLKKNDYIQGFFSGLAQFGTVWGLANLVDLMLPFYDAGSKPLSMALYTLGFGSMFGIWNSFYQNWRSRGGKWVRDIKNMGVSFSYYFGIYFIGGAGVQKITLHDLSIDPAVVVSYIQSLIDSIPSVNEAVATASSIHPLAALAASHFFINFAINNELKNVGFWRQKIREIERTDLGDISIKLPTFKKDEATGKRSLVMNNVPIMTKRFWNRQYKYYLPVNMSKFLDQAWFGATILPAMSGDLPAWYPLLSVFGFFSLTYTLVRVQNKWAYDKHAIAAEKLKMREESAHYYGQYYVDKAKSLVNKCTQLLSPRSI